MLPRIRVMEPPASFYELLSYCAGANWGPRLKNWKALAKGQAELPAPKAKELLPKVSPASAWSRVHRLSLTLQAPRKADSNRLKRLPTRPRRDEAFANLGENGYDVTSKQPALVRRSWESQKPLFCEGFGQSLGVVETKSNLFGRLS